MLIASIVQVEVYAHTKAHVSLGGGAPIQVNGDYSNPPLRTRFRALSRAFGPFFAQGHFRFHLIIRWVDLLFLLCRRLSSFSLRVGDASTSSFYQAGNVSIAYFGNSRFDNPSMIVIRSIVSYIQDSRARHSSSPTIQSPVSCERLE